VDGLSLVSCLEVLVLKKWNNFKARTDSPVILDCGANIGISVLNYKREYPKARITAFEADPHIASVLKENLKHNGASDVRVVEKAVWTKEGRMPFFCEGADGSRILSSGSASTSTTEVETIDFGTFLSEPVDLVKMDIEGAEFEVISHVRGNLKNVHNIIVECHVNVGDIMPFANLLQIFHSSGFSVAVNSYGIRRDLVNQPKRLVNEFDQYFLVAAWRDEGSGVR